MIDPATGCLLAKQARGFPSQPMHTMSGRWAQARSAAAGPPALTLAAPAATGRGGAVLSDVVSHRLSGTPLGHAPLAPLGIINQSSQAANIKSQVNTSQVVCDGVWAQDQCATRSPISVQPSGNPLSRASKRRTATTSENVYDKRCTAIGTVFRPQLLRQCEATPTMLRHNEVMKSATKHIAKGGHKWGPCEPIPSSPVCPCPLPGTGRGSTPDAGPRTPSSASSAAASPNDLQLIPCHPPEPAAAAEGQATPATSPQPAPGRPSRDAAAAAAALSSGCHRCPAPRPEDPRAHTMDNDNPCPLSKQDR